MMSEQNLRDDVLHHQDKESLPLLSRANQDADAPHWANETIQPWDEHGFRSMNNFIRRYYWCGNASVNVFRIVGTKHPDYQGKTWLELLNRGKRMHINLRLHKENPGYYLDQEHKTPTMSFVTLNGMDLYVDADGNHRTVIAKFDYHYRSRTMLHGVEVAHYEIDMDLYRIYMAMQEWIEQRRYIDPWRIAPHNKVIAREDDAGWKVDIYQPAIEVRGIKNGGKPQLLDYEAAVKLFERWRRFGSLTGTLYKWFRRPYF